jgi:hypothetical protein
LSQILKGAVALSTEEVLFSKLLTLQEELEKALPNYKESLREIHNLLRSDPDMVHILSEEQVGLVVAGLSKHKGVVLVEATSKGGKGKRKEITEDDI